MKEMIQQKTPRSLLLYNALLTRKKDMADEEYQFERRFKGFLGELAVINHVAKINQRKILSLYDCLFEVEDKEFQTDYILLTANRLILLEVKNYADQYHYENGKLFNIRTKKEIYNPLTQLERAEYLCKQLLEELNIRLDIQSYILFTDPNFLLYNSPLQSPFIFSQQIEPFLNRIEQNAPALPKHVTRIADRLKLRRKEVSNYEVTPDYTYKEIKLGLYCTRCRDKLKRVGQLYFRCNHCKHRYHLSKLLWQTICEFHLLFPDKKITTKQIYDWCDGEYSRVFISRFLGKHLKGHKRGKYSYYTFHHEKDPIKQLAGSFFEEHLKDRVEENQWKTNPWINDVSQ